jgi:hypothetical protein
LGDWAGLGSGEGCVGGTWLEGLEATGGVEDDAEVACEGGANGTGPCLGIDLDSLASKKITKGFEGRT